MIHIVGINDRKRTGSKFYYDVNPLAAIKTIQRPFSHMSVGPNISTKTPTDTENSLKEYRKWLFKRLLTSHVVIQEFSEILFILIQEGDIILQCSCVPPKPCHGTIIRDALTWAEPHGVENWHAELKRIASKNLQKRK
jgi:hypothetical protein